MDLISKTILINELNKKKQDYREDTELGLAFRGGLQDAISTISDTYTFTTLYLGESELNKIIEDSTKRLKLLAAEPIENIFSITGYHSMRYTRCHEKAKQIMSEEFRLVLGDIESDYADTKIGIEMIKVRESNLGNYIIE
jgi:hypothetical protein